MLKFMVISTDKSANRNSIIDTNNNELYSVFITNKQTGILQIENIDSLSLYPSLIRVIDPDRNKNKPGIT